MKACDLILVKGTDFISEAIEEVTVSKYSHVAGYVGKNDLIEAEGFEKTSHVYFTKYAGKYDVYVCDILTDKQREAIIKYAENEVGGRYDYRLIFIELFRYLFRKNISYKESYKSKICSTLWSEAFRSVGVDLCPNIEYPTPQDLAESKLLRKL